MRRAIQRCSAAAIPRSLSSTLSSSSFAQTYRLSINGTARQQWRVGAQFARSLHQSSRLSEAVATEAEETPDAAVTRFDELGSRNILHPNVVRTLTEDMKLETMTEVQSRTINEALRGDDIIAQAKTGTGKTLAFLIPILQNVIKQDPELAKPVRRRRGPRSTADDIRALIVSPTRELAEQIAMEARKLVARTGLIVQTAVGGTLKRQGLEAIQRQGCHILVGTPGRLKDILSDPRTRVEAPDLSALVFDEGDRLLDQGFWPEIQEIMRLLPTPAEKDRQTMMFSATVPQEVVSLVRSTLKPGFQFVKCVRDDEEPTHQRVPQNIVSTKGLENGLPVLMEMCIKGIAAAKEEGARPFKSIVYFNSTAEVQLAAETLMRLSGGEQQGDAFGRGRFRHPWHPTEVFFIHSKLTQQQRTRASDMFRQAKSAVLLSTDVTARGMDFPNVSHVIQVGLPTSREQYIHRIGRTGRAGREGEGWLIINDMEVQEARQRLRGLPLQPDDSLVTSSLDLTQAAQVPAQAGEILSQYQNAMRKVSSEYKDKVYKAMLGVFGWYNNRQKLVNYMNNLSRFGWGMETPPPISPLLAERLKLTRVQGLNFDQGFGGGSGRDRGYGGDRGGDRYGNRGGDRYGNRGGDRYGDRRGGDRFGRGNGDPFSSSRGGRDAFAI